MWLAQYTRDVIEWFLQTFRSCREVRGYVRNREHFLCTEIGFDRVGGILLPVLRKLLILTFNPINWNRDVEVILFCFFCHSLCAEGHDCVLIWRTLISSARWDWVKIWKLSVTCILCLYYLHVIYSGFGVTMSLLMAHLASLSTTWMTDERIINIGEIVFYSVHQSSGRRTSTSVTSLPHISYGLPWERNWLSVVRSLTVTRLLMRSVLGAWKESFASPSSHFLTCVLPTVV
jgi:hypothetical protein